MVENKISLKPCDCIDQRQADMLNEQGIGCNNNNITIEPSVVILTIDRITIRIPMKLFKMFSEWYLEPQEIKIDK